MKVNLFNNETQIKLKSVQMKTYAIGPEDG